ncbi:protein-disulfide reductase DsbD [Winslowiella iniecta]|uniref:Thiol:disulfide interchange protein DsbD n=1 Tax=Winslowiella iniecta TaxID=1560201 RepID=A0A0L7TCX8_9GAMM|nr:protein-disulfide reductase DsbD [Winslowiella iniecta]KOC90660.1 thiol:disulfide interchange protein precursor [Winslowiella iniecta]KOC93086.1 thiol:disulfide interchange protein precursor [Winslowiella iniecta]
MAQRIFKLVLILLVGLFSIQANASLFGQQNTSQFVPVDQAFAFDFNQKDHQLTLSWQVKPGYYLYRQQITIEPHAARLAQFSLPQGQPHEDEFYGKTEIYPDDLHLPLTLLQADGDATVRVTYQGCASAGFCYPPETRDIPLSKVAARAAADTANTAISQQPAPTTETNLPFSPLWALLIGIGVAFTPCVLPMYPLISGIILGGSKRLSFGRLLALALVYVQGMALTYTLMGVVVAAAGLRFQAALQHPYVLIGLSALFVLLALSMFGLFSLQLPSALQTRLTLWSNRQQGGSLFGVFLMGALAGLICSPCTTAPLSAILLYIAQSGNMLAGAGTLYLYALGMGLPLIAITLFGNKLLPKSGPWMQTVKQGFGFVILALPVFLLERVIGELWGLRLWSLLGVAFFSWAFITSLGSGKGWLRVLQVILLLAALVSVRPLQDWAFAPPATATTAAHLDFARIASSDDLTQALKNNRHKISMLDLYADWCVACKEFEKYTFSDALVQTSLADVQLIQADVTANSATDSALLQRLQVLGLPTILFFDASGNEIPGSRITGFMNAAAFKAHLQKVIP